MTDMPEKIRIEFICFSESIHDEIPSQIVLGEKESGVMIPVLIGENEANWLSSLLKGEKNSRPNTADLVVSMIECFGITLEEIFIYHYEDGVFKAELVMEKEGKTYRIDARPSDAIYIMQKINVPIYTTREIIDKAGMKINKGPCEEPYEAGIEEEETLSGEPELGKIATSDLEEMLKRAIDNEEYEMAAIIHSEIKQRSKTE